MLRTGALAPVLAELMTYCHDLTMFRKAGEMPSREFEEAGRGLGGSAVQSRGRNSSILRGVVMSLTGEVTEEGRPLRWNDTIVLRGG